MAPCVGRAQVGCDGTEALRDSKPRKWIWVCPEQLDCGLATASRASRSADKSPDSGSQPNWCRRQEFRYRYWLRSGVNRISQVLVRSYALLRASRGEC